MEQVTALLHCIDALSVLYNRSKATWEHLNKFNIKEPKRLVFSLQKGFQDMTGTITYWQCHMQTYRSFYIPVLPAAE